MGVGKTNSHFLDTNMRTTKEQLRTDLRILREQFAEVLFFLGINLHMDQRQGP